MKKFINWFFNFYSKQRVKIRPISISFIIIFGIFFTITSDVEYKSERVLLPSDAQSTLGILEGIGGSGLFSGLGTQSDSSDSEKFKLLLFSNEIASQLFENTKITKQLLSKHYDKDGILTYKYGLSDYLISALLSLRGESYNPVADHRIIVTHLKENIFITENRESKALTITYYSFDPEFSEYLLDNLVETTLESISLQKKNIADKKMQYLSNELFSSTNNSVKESLANAYEAELKIKMDADLNINIYEVVESSAISFKPYRPSIFNSIFITIIFLMIFLFLEMYLFSILHSKKVK